VASAPSLATLRTTLRRQRAIIDQHQATLDAQFRHIAALQMDVDRLTANRPAPVSGDELSRSRSWPALLSPPGQLRRIPAARR
jgi:hypothetical protein